MSSLSRFPPSPSILRIESKRENSSLRRGRREISMLIAEHAEAIVLAELMDYFDASYELLESTASAKIRRSL